MRTKENIITELKNAYRAQIEGNEGLARVCARRAAGWAIQIHLNDQGINLNTPSALDYIKYLNDQKDTSRQLQQTLSYFLQRVEKDNEDEESYWPLAEVDLVKEAHMLSEKMLSLKIDVS